MKRDLVIIAICLITIFTLMGCTALKPDSCKFSKQNIELKAHKLATYSVIKNTKYLIVFESGLGNDSSVWRQTKVAEKAASKSDVLLYERAGYGKSTMNIEPRNITALSLDLENVINKYANGRKVILVGHSLGGMIIRDYAIRHPNETAAILFIDPAHEMYNQPTQKEEDDIYNACKKYSGEKSGASLEARELIEDSQYMSTLPNLPNVPVIVITSMKNENGKGDTDKKLWYEAHEKLKEGVSDFTHMTTTKSGHYIMIFEPQLVLTAVDTILLKIN